MIVEDFILPGEAAELTGLTIHGLTQLRYLGQGPVYYKPSKRVVLYRRSEVLAWVESTVHGREVVTA